MMLSNLEIIRSTYEGTAEENGKKYQTYLAKDAKWTEAAGFPYGGTFIGYEDIAQHVFVRLGSEWDGFNAKLTDIYEDGNTVIAVGLYSGTYKQTGKYFEAEFVHIWKLENGSIVEFKQYVDSHLVRQAMIED